MSSIINEVIKDAIKEAASRHVILTPDNYFALFCEAAKKKGVLAPECNKLDKYLSKLDAHYQEEAQKMKVKNIDELFAFISSRLNRTNAGENLKTIQAFTLLVKRILQSLSVLHNTEARNLANVSLQTIDAKLSADNLNLIKDKWLNFLTNYDDSYLKKLESYGIKQNDDLQTIINTLLTASMSVSGGDKDYAAIAEIIIGALVPSIASSMNDELAEISEQLKQKPELIETSGMRNDIKKFVVKRVSLDKDEFKSKITELDNILDNIDKQIKFFINKFDVKDVGLEDIRNDLQSISVSDEYKNVKIKLEKVSESIGFKLQDFVFKLKESEQTISVLKAQIRELQERLIKTTEEAKSDFLTGLSSKRALEDEIMRMEAIFTRYGVEYSVCFFDIDHFKAINDTYGHDTGDVILAKVGEILNLKSREVDMIGRFGGEEFVALLPKTELKDAEIFAEKILDCVRQFQFIYKESKFNITMSCGVSVRSKCENAKDTLKRADELLYAAKNGGRDNVKIQTN